jgi:hypothetical protein
MGTSVNHPSPEDTNWKPVRAAYTYENIPLERLLADIWRAVENDPQPLSRTMESDALFRCYQAVKESSSVQQAIRNISTELVSSRQNSIVAEFAKRAVPAAFKSKAPAQEWRAVFFAEITNYLVSRDASGYVGSQFRNKTISDLVDFKQNVSKQVGEVVRSVRMDPKNSAEWRSFVQEAITNIRGERG